MYGNPILHAHGRAKPDGPVPFAEEDGGRLFCFHVRGSDFGAVYYCHREVEYGGDPEEHVTDPAKSIAACIHSLTEDEEGGVDDEA